MLDTHFQLKDEWKYAFNQKSNFSEPSISLQSVKITQFCQSFFPEPFGNSSLNTLKSVGMAKSEPASYNDVIVFREIGNM